MYRDRLEYLAREILPYVDEEHFNMSEWAGDCPNSCGTAACAAGHHALSANGHKQGFKMYIARNSLGEIYDSFIMYKNHEGIDACVLFYDISKDDAFELFDPGCYWGPEREGGNIPAAVVAARIESLLAAESELEPA